MSELSSQHKAEIVKHLKQVQKVQAIKYARAAFNISLKDSVRLVNTVDQELNPDKKIDLDSFSNVLRLPKIYYVIFGGLGALMMIGAGIMFMYDYNAASKSVKTRGIVIEFRYDEGAASPVVSYEWNGAEYTYYSTTYSDPPSFQIGEEVELFVDPSDPTNAMINSFSERYLGIIILGGLGAMFLGILFLIDRTMGKIKLK
jgi:hypothetical protein